MTITTRRNTSNDGKPIVSMVIIISFCSNGAVLAFDLLLIPEVVLTDAVVDLLFILVDKCAILVETVKSLLIAGSVKLLPVVETVLKFPLSVEAVEPFPVVG